MKAYITSKEEGKTSIRPLKGKQLVLSWCHSELFPTSCLDERRQQSIHWVRFFGWLRNPWKQGRRHLFHIKFLCQRTAKIDSRSFFVDVEKSDLLLLKSLAGVVTSNGSNPLVPNAGGLIIQEENRRTLTRMWKVPLHRRPRAICGECHSTEGKIKTTPSRKIYKRHWSHFDKGIEDHPLWKVSIILRN